MRRRNRMLMLACCLLTLLLGGAGALAQRQGQTPQAEREQPRVVLQTTQPNGEPPGEAKGMLIRKREGGGYDFQEISNFFSVEMSFDGQVVKGAPYSAEAVTESVQAFADGNRIVRKSTALLYRDSEGRTRREQTLNNVGPFATAGDAPNIIFINDPVGGANYVLDSRARSARKSAMYFKSSDDPQGPPAGALQVELIGPPQGPSPAGGPPPPPMGPKGPPPLRHEALKRVEPVYPPIARAAGAQGLVTVQIVIDEQGNVVSARVTSGHPLLRQAAVDAARQWVFKPTIINGQPAKVTGTLSFSFVLSEVEDVSDMPPPPPPHRGPPPPPKFPEVKESLGRQTIEGVEAEGTRITVTIPAGEIGNERPIQIVTERWYAPDLHAVVLTKHSDPRYGETTYRLTNINRSEPARALFEVPPDFTIKGPDRAQQELRMRRQKEQP